MVVEYQRGGLPHVHLLITKMQYMQYINIYMQYIKMQSEPH